MDQKGNYVTKGGEIVTCHHDVVDWQARDEVYQKPALKVVACDRPLLNDNNATAIVIGCAKVEANILYAEQTAHDCRGWYKASVVDTGAE